MSSEVGVSCCSWDRERAGGWDRERAGTWSTERAAFAAPPHRIFFGAATLLFIASTAVTIVWCGSMSAMGGMAMPGGWTMPMTWMRMPGQTWPGAAASFLGMWTVMMVAMMLPSLVQMLWRYRLAVGRRGEPHLGTDRARLGTGGAELDRLTALVSTGYFAVWSTLGLVAFALGVAIAEFEMQQPALARAVPVVAGLAVLAAGVLQLTAWKSRQLACCRETPTPTLPANASTAWRHGLLLGLRCCRCCAGPTTVLLVLGVMDLRAMAVVTAAITAERFAPAGERVARVIGAGVVALGLSLIVRAAGLV